MLRSAQAVKGKRFSDVDKCAYLCACYSFLLFLGELDQIRETPDFDQALQILDTKVVGEILASSILAYRDLARAQARSKQFGLLKQVESCKELLVESVKSSKDPAFVELAGHVMFRALSVLPACCRQWWITDCPKDLESDFQSFVEIEASALVANREIGLVQYTAGLGAADDFTVVGRVAAREITAVYHKDECAMEIAIRLPKAYPLRNVEVECRRKLGVPEGRWRKWTLQIVTTLASQDGSVLGAVELWKKNVDKQFEGIEPCPICYSILQPKIMALPSLECQTCHNKFHSDCLQKWFNTSHKSKCPLCQQPFH